MNYSNWLGITYELRANILHAAESFLFHYLCLHVKKYESEGGVFSLWFFTQFREFQRVHGGGFSVVALRYSMSTRILPNSRSEITNAI